MSTYATYSIKDLEIMTDIKSHTIRMWEKRYGILQPGRSDTNIRYYTNEDLKKLLNVSFLNQQGIKISRIAEMSEEEIRLKVQTLNLVSSSDTALVESMIVAMIELNEARFQDILNTAALKYGFEQAVTQVVFPFFQRIGIMWQTGVINPAQEHFVSNLVRNKIIAATEALDYRPDPALRKVVLLLPETELHEIGLLFYNYVLRAHGFPTCYLGQIVPLDSVGRIVDITHPDLLVCSVTNSLNAIDMNGLLRRIAAVFSGPVLVSGSALSVCSDAIPANVKTFSRATELLSLISAL